MTAKKGGRREDVILSSLRELYASYGYGTYRMSRFEEYDLYAGNRDFLVSGNIITFTDTDGTLMALKPDVTLSIARSLREDKDRVSRVCYTENVYRVSESTGSFREIMQAGVECMGDITTVEMAETAALAEKSLSIISPSSTLSVSHMGIVERILEGAANDDRRKRALRDLGTRNFSDLERMAGESYGDRSVMETLAYLALNDDSDSAVLSRIASGCAMKEMAGETESILSVLTQNRTHLDFSVLGAMNYYNGIVFRGYVERVPVSVLSGGRYDRLMQRLGKNAKAAGFAIYMDELERLWTEEREYDVDTVLLYSDGDDVAAVLEKADELRRSGESVASMREIPVSLRYRRALKAGGGKDA